MNPRVAWRSRILIMNDADLRITYGPLLATFRRTVAADGVLMYAGMLLANLWFWNSFTMGWASAVTTVRYSLLARNRSLSHPG
jgi:hypothetical protein